MCIIIAKRKNDRLPTNKELEHCFSVNRDGAGFMYVADGFVHIDKGYMTYDKFIKRYNELCKKYNNFKDKSLVIHCRIGTSSGNIAENTHPYPITNNEKYLHALNVKCSLGMAHNGIIPGYTPTWLNPTTNDTQEFVMKFVYELRKRWNDFYKNERMLSALGKITNSRLAFLDTNDEIYLVGEWVTEDGLKFSNGSYKPYTYTYGKWNTCGTYKSTASTPTTYKKNNLLTDYTKVKKEDYEDFSKKAPVTTSDYPMSDGKAFPKEDIDELIDDFVRLKNTDLIYVSTTIGWRKVGTFDELYYDLNTGDVYRYYPYVKEFKQIYSNVFAYNKDFELIDDVCNNILDRIDYENESGALV